MSPLSILGYMVALVATFFLYTAWRVTSGTTDVTRQRRTWEAQQRNSRVLTRLEAFWARLTGSTLAPQP